MTTLEILGLKQGKEADKREALCLLTCVANAGRKHKELICESYGKSFISEKRTNRIGARNQLLNCSCSSGRMVKLSSSLI